MSTRTVAVIGGSVIGLACAFRARQAGFAVTVCEPDGGAGQGDGLPGNLPRNLTGSHTDAIPGSVPRHAAAWVAGGMLAPYSEAWPGEPEALHLGVEALRAWPALLEDLAEFAAPGPADTDPWTAGPIRAATEIGRAHV